MNFKTFLVAAALTASAGIANALTVITTDCGTLTAANATCGDYEVNLAFNDTQWAFEGTIGDTSGSLTIHTYTDPYWSSGESLGNIRLVIGDYDEGYGATVTWGGATVDLVYSFGTLVYEGVFANFLDIEDNGIDFVLTWTGLKGGEAVSVILTAVPLPAGGILLLSALGGLGLARRRRSAEPAIA